MGYLTLAGLGFTLAGVALLLHYFSPPQVTPLSREWLAQQEYDRGGFDIVRGE